MPLNIDPKTQIQAFARARNSRNNEMVEDYVELIADLQNEVGKARLNDLAKRLGVSNATASKIINRLQQEGFIITEPYRPLELTTKGSVLAKKCKLRHQIVMKFLLKLGVSWKNAAIDAEGIEHHISDETLDLFLKFSQNNKTK